MRFAGLRRVSLSSEDWSPGGETFSGQLRIDDPFFERNAVQIGGDAREVSLRDSTISAERYAEWKESRAAIDGNSQAMRVLLSFDLKNMSRSEEEIGIPDARIVTVRYDVDVPARILEID